MIGKRIIGWLRATLARSEEEAVSKVDVKGVPVEPVRSVPIWLKKARTCIGQKEIPGSKHNPWIVSLWRRMGAAIRDDETPWCGTFVALIMKKSGFKPPKKWMAARSWNNWELEIEEPVPGCIVAFWRGSRNGWRGHVGFVDHVTPSGMLAVLGANQRDMVRISSFYPKGHPKSRVLSYRWPAGVPIPKGAIPVGREEYELSTNEA